MLFFFLILEIRGILDDWNGQSMLCQRALRGRPTAEKFHLTNQKCEWIMIP